MDYKAENIDTDKALEHLNFYERNANTNEILEKNKIEQYYKGYRDGLSVAKDMFYCKNYEKK